MKLFLKNISLPLNPFTLEADVELCGRVTAIFGPSGAGKTSLLELVAGLRKPHSGRIELDDTVLNDASQRLCVAPHLRRIGYVPQDLALFPHLSVLENIRYGEHPKPAGNLPDKLDSILEALDIRELLKCSIAELSGGQKQRVALARALQSSPQLLLLDEPLASLDVQLKKRVIPHLIRVRDEFAIPMLYVTHDRYETLAIADELVVLVNGRIVQTGAVQAVFEKPANTEVANLLCD